MRGSDSWLRRVAVALLVAGFALAPVGFGAAAATAQAGAPLRISVLSNRADLISGGDALVEVALPAGVPASRVRVTAAGRDVTKAFAMRPNGKFQGLVKALPLGASVLRATAGASSGSVTVTNHPNGGPVFSGPQVKPWTCQPTAVDKQCNQPPKFEYFYKASTPIASAGFKPYDPANPPSDVASTTTDQGVQVPFVIRVETGYQDRDQYQIATLFQPGKSWQPWAPQEQWNNKVVMVHGGGCGISYASGEAPAVRGGATAPLVGDVLPIEVPFEDAAATMLSRGFAVVSTALNNNGHNCNITVQAESMMMVKERLVETYGEIRYTMGSGCSGGSITQQAVANAYPGIYQGLVVTCSYPDTASPGVQFFDYHLLRKYFEDPSKWGSGVVWNPAQWAAVEGHLLPLNAVVADEGLFKGAFTPTTACPGISDDRRYHPDTNPAGVRCDVFEGLVNQFGKRGPGVWSKNEKRLGKGFPGRPVDNVGVQYGLEALRSGVITPEMFADLNSKIGGLDVDAKHLARRSVADQPALRNMYRDGWHNSASNLDSVAIIDHGGPDPGLAHDARWAWSMRDRLDREQGHHDNHVIWFGAFPIMGDPGYITEGLLAMDRWLTAVENDKRDVPVADKIVQDRPGDLRDRCSQVQGLSSKDGLNIPLASPLLRELLGPALNPILDALNDGLNPVVDPALRLIVDPVLDTVCGAGLVGETLRTDFDTPRGVAGQSNTSDDHKCQLKPLNRNDDYGPSALTDAQWATLQKAFPHGVCDYSKPGVGKQDAVAWLTYQDCRGSVIYGGTPLGSAPARSGTGWNSRAFDGWQQTGARGNLGTCAAPKTGSGGSAGGSIDKPATPIGNDEPRPATGPATGSSDAAAANDAAALASTGSPLASMIAAAMWLLAVGLLITRFALRRVESGRV